jgi:hypothetical protein
MVAVGALLISIGATIGCRTSSESPVPMEPQSNAPLRTGLDSLSQPDAALYEGIVTADRWKNPIIWVRYDSVSVTSTSTSRIVVTTDDLEEALRSIPSADWPYGRAVAYAEASILSGSDEVRINERRVLVVETARRLQVTLVVWPTA